MTASATSSFISITDPTSVKVATNHFRGWMRSTGIVSVSSIPPKPSSYNYFPVRSEGGQGCQKAQDEAHANGTISSAGLDSANSMGSGPPDSAGSFAAMDLYRGDVKAEPDNWMSGGILM